MRLPDTGTVAIDAQTVRFAQTGLVEEHSVSMDDVRQDLVSCDSFCISQEKVLQLVLHLLSVGLAGR